ncbi:hypothetical protein SAMN05421776_12156 [Nocardia farcinica]|uniref:Uncharacterized protein n=1 Tax=Nocardia farcinica TaxID=37329 RepID=A0A0H5P9V4_NOCFR|nr:hypothetical protein [Nocardia farcinica]SLG32751.1 Uncharacterised protein [Mycobacteroides abscessus subsp. abscessus]AXK88547.1 hypothetical protein DXT66_25650 [Nocardia farcinica]PFW98849.1 hypothetical protein CJ469_05810 [Nocardia farcinica]PFX04455.1 hypothetical protein CJ468_05431 [Nocardia farcinica]CRY84213.1 Uncharacterised protein [Nocardia farcinica]
MIFAFTVAADAGLVWLLASAVAIAKFDTWGDRLIPVARAAAVTGLVSTAVFVVLFGLYALGIDIGRTE